MELFFYYITWLGSILVLLPGALGIVALFWRTLSSADIFLILGGLIGSSLVAHLMKLIFSRPRPHVVDEMLVSMPRDFSFPSAHTAQTTGFFVALALVAYRYTPVKIGSSIWAISGLIMFFVGYSRIYLKVHYISDVIVGAVLGISWSFILNWIIHILFTGGIHAK